MMDSSGQIPEKYVFWFWCESKRDRPVFDVLEKNSVGFKPSGLEGCGGARGAEGGGFGSDQAQLR